MSLSLLKNWQLFNDLQMGVKCFHESFWKHMEVYNDQISVGLLGKAWMKLLQQFLWFCVLTKTKILKYGHLPIPLSHFKYHHLSNIKIPANLSNWVEACLIFEQPHVTQGCHIPIEIKFAVFSLWFPYVLNFFPVSFSIKNNICSTTITERKIPLWTTITIASFHFPVHQLKIYSKIQNNTDTSHHNLGKSFNFSKFKMFPVMEVNHCVKTTF